MTTLTLQTLQKRKPVRGLTFSRSRLGFIAGAVLGIASIVPIPVHAALLPYIYTPLNTTDLFQSTGRGATNGFVVGYGAGTATGGNSRALSWNLSTGTRTILDDTDLVRSYAFGATNGYAAGNVSNNTFGDKAAVWDLSTGIRTVLPTTGANVFAYINSVSGGVAGGYQTINGGYVASAWDVATKSLLSLDTTGFYSSFATGATGATVVGYGSISQPDFTLETSAFTWNKDTGVRSTLDKTGLATTHAYGASNGLILGDGAVQANGNGQAVVWNTFTGTRTLLDSSGLQASIAYFASNGVVFGQGTATGSNESRSLAWDLNTGTRYDLTSLVFPTGAQNVLVNAVDEDTGTLTGSNNGDAYALTVVSSNGESTIGSDQTAYAPTTYEHQSGTNTVNGTLQFTDSTNKDYRLEGGTLKGTGVIGGNLFNTGGTIAPGNSPGTLTVTGDFSQSGGVYSVELASLSTFDQLAITGSASFTGGSLLVTALTGYTPAIGDFFDIVSTGNGITISGVSVPDGYTFTQNGGNGRLTFVGVAAVPEVNTALLALLVAPIALIALRRRN